MVPVRTIRTLLNVLMGAALFLAVALVAPVAGEDLWKVKAPERWTVDEALGVLQHSPWAREHDVSMPWLLPRKPTYAPRASLTPGRPAPQDPIPAEWRRSESRFTDWARYRVRWDSARPVQDAFARLFELGEDLAAEFQSPPPSRPGDRYVITVKAVRPPQMGREPLELLGDRKLLEAARLKTRKGEVKAAEVARTGMGANAAVHFYFPRTLGGAPLVGVEGERVEFKLELRQISLKSKFRLEPEWVR